MTLSNSLPTMRSRAVDIKFPQPPTTLQLMLPHIRFQPTRSPTMSFDTPYQQMPINGTISYKVPPGYQTNLYYIPVSNVRYHE